MSKPRLVALERDGERVTVEVTYESATAWYGRAVAGGDGRVVFTKSGWTEIDRAG